MKLTDLGEFPLIRILSRRVPHEGRFLKKGIGDDAAVIQRMGAEDWLITTDMLVEGVHFRRDWSSVREIGRRAMLVNLSDISAMGGRPRFAFISLGIPRRMIVGEIEELYRGIGEICRKTGVVIAGGDTNRSPRFVISVTLVGETIGGGYLLRSGAKVGDQLYVTGQLGHAALKLRQRHPLEPPLRIRIGKELVRKRWATSCIDLSDGFLQDLGHILEESRVGAEVFVDRLPGFAPRRLKLTGGEDYELLFTAPPRVNVPRKIDGVPVSLVGRIIPLRGGIRLMDNKGRVRLPRRRGFSHF
jgi:thiamine-monophosphate kinase